MSYSTYGTGNPIFKVFNASGVTMSSYTLAAEIITVNDIMVDEESIKFTNIGKQACKRKAIRRIIGRIEIYDISTAALDAIMYAAEHDGDYGWRIELQPYADNTALKIDVVFDNTIYPIQAGGVYAPREITLQWRAVTPNVAYSTIKKYT